jgi:hypothetical protein
MNQFGLIGEGVTDQIIINAILFSYFPDPDLLVTNLQPLRDETHKDLSTNGNWDKVLEYCGSEVFRDAFQALDYIVIQIDSDVFSSGEVPAKYRNVLLTGNDYQTVIDKIKEFLIESIGDNFYTKFKERIIFAIAVDSIECWLLPLYYPNEPKKAGKITGCISTLNQALSKEKDGFYINEKNTRDYYKMVKGFNKKPRDFQNCVKLNPSLHVFVSSLAHITP